MKEYTLDPKMPIGVFDSGLGGLSTLMELKKRLPSEDFIYYGDFANAPYGSKSAEDVRALAYECTRRLLERGVKALVIACNTATSAAAKQLREDFGFLPIIGAEPALKPAVLHKNGSRVLVLATEMTLSEEKFKNLCAQYSTAADIVPLACPGLADKVEMGITDPSELCPFLEELIRPAMSKRPDAVVLGCTHYPFVADAISRIVGQDVPLFDGNVGIANECARRLENINLIRSGNNIGKTEITGSGVDREKLLTAQKLMEKK